MATSYYQTDDNEIGPVSDQELEAAAAGADLFCTASAARRPIGRRTGTADKSSGTHGSGRIRKLAPAHADGLEEMV